MCDPELGQPACGGDDCVEVQERLAHAHVHRVVHGLLAPEVQRLVEDLGLRQVASEAHRAGRAEGARQRAARLRGEAQRAASVAVAHEDGLDRMAVGRLEESLDRAVPRFLLGDELQRRERHGLLEPGPERFRKRRHRVVGLGPARGPLPDLPRAVGRLTQLGEGAFEEHEIHGATVTRGRAVAPAPCPRVATIFVVNTPTRSGDFVHGEVPAHPPRGHRRLPGHDGDPPARHRRRGPSRSWCRATKACTPRSARSPRSSRPRGCPAAPRLRR